MPRRAAGRRGACSRGAHNLQHLLAPLIASAFVLSIPKPGQVGWWVPVLGMADASALGACLGPGACHVLGTCLIVLIIGLIMKYWETIVGGGVFLLILYAVSGAVLDWLGNNWLPCAVGALTIGAMVHRNLIAAMLVRAWDGSAVSPGDAVWSGRERTNDQQRELASATREELMNGMNRRGAARRRAPQALISPAFAEATDGQLAIFGGVVNHFQQRNSLRQHDPQLVAAMRNWRSYW